MSNPKKEIRCEVWSRVVGFYRPVYHNWPKHKQVEFEQRKTFDVAKAVKKAEV